MTLGFYPKLAWEGIRKNKRLYLPYIITCIGMVMMHYILYYLACSPVLEHMPGTEVISSMLGMGSQIIALFALLFLFYSNSFLMRRRKKEFGLYNILGMGKWNISRILFWEVVIVAGLALICGTGFGIALSKLFELILLNMMSGEVSFSFTVSASGILQTILVFGVIFGLLFLNALRQISLRNPIELLRSESAGEKPPKANWLAGILGLLVLGGAYYLAVTIEDPVTALSVFFLAVLMVICATYLLFISGSVVLCRMLQKNKKYYYKKNHFVSVASMTYRMKRNGAGLASICILLTMVLVMLSSTAALFVGMEDILHVRYPKDINIEMSTEQLQDQAQISEIRKNVQTVLDTHNAVPENVYDYRAAVTSGFLQDGVLYNDASAFANFQEGNTSDLVLTFFVPISDYNRLMGENQVLKEGEVLLYPFRTEYSLPTFQVNGGEEYRVKEVVDAFVDNGESSMTIFPTVFIFVQDLDAIGNSLKSLASFSGDSILEYRWFYAFDLGVSSEEQIEVYDALTKTGIASNVSIECLEERRTDFYTLFGGLFFLGIMLSLVFLAAAVLIIYYKQISEGYEDQARFEIMQKVGMTKKEIRKTINSQMLTVFFLPLLAAGIHLCFAFPIIRKLLLMFNLWNTSLLVLTTVAAFLIFGLFYVIVYRLTSNAYFSIVSGRKE